MAGAPARPFTTPLAGRDRELRTVGHLLDGLPAGASSAVAVVGEPGIGKTRLLEELGTRAAARGCTVLTGRASEVGTAGRFGLLADALDGALADLDPADLRRLGDGPLAALGTVFPSLSGRPGTSAPPAGDGALHVRHAVRAVLRHVVTRRPLVVTLDDAHHADPASLDVVLHLVRKPVAGMLTALSYRPSGAEGLRSAIARAAREQHLEVLELRPLSREGAADALGGGVLPRVLDSLHVDSGGNPLNLEQLARATGLAGRILPAGARPAGFDIPAPPILRAVTEQELSGLSSPARSLAEAGAVTGDPFDVDVALEVADLSEAVAWTAVDELMAVRLVQPTGVPGRLRFRHPVTRWATYSATGPGWRIGAHRRATRTLERRGAPPAVRAEHLARSALTSGDRDAVSLLVEAAAAAAGQAPAAAGRWLEAALRLLPNDAPAACRRGLLEDLARSMSALGRPRAARAALEDALHLLPPEDRGGRVRITADVARVHQRSGQGQEARTRLETALTEAVPGSAPAVALGIELALNHALLKEWTKGARMATEVLDTARDQGDRELAVQARAVSALLHAFCAGPLPAAAGGAASDGHTGEDAGREADGLAALADEELTSGDLAALENLVHAEILGDRWTDAAQHARRGARLCEARGMGARYLAFEVLGVPSLVHRGRLARARETADAVVEALRLGEPLPALAFGEAMRCWIASLQGQTRVALAAGEHAVKAGGKAPDSLLAWLPPTFLGEALVAAGRPERGRTLILQAGGRDLSDVAPSARPHWFRILAEADAATGDIDSAEEMAFRARALADDTTLPARGAEASLAEAAVLLARDRTRRALAKAWEARAGFDEAGASLDTARAALLVGTLQSRTGDPDSATATLDGAHASFQGYGATRLADRAAKELRRLGRRVVRQVSGRPPSDRPTDLTPREREVADLVAQGKTTRQVADELFVSAKTVETHIAHIYAKLGVSSRVAMAAAMAGPPVDHR